MIPLLVFIAALSLAVVAALAAASRHKKSTGAPLSLVGRVGTIEKDLAPEGAVLVAGELMAARSRTGEQIRREICARVRVVGARGHCLLVEPES
ncbi:MAG TPA: NfeD family protein [Pyrinomonadaceae bacterium]|jgi:membrane-bound ClpP family serine protease|nr:NfeD family protein [Pyrinomonadaceae bacterium]